MIGAGSQPDEYREGSSKTRYDHIPESCRPDVGILAILCTVLFNAGLCPVTASPTNHTDQGRGNPPIRERLEASSNSARFSQSLYKKRAASGPEARLWCSNRYLNRYDTAAWIDGRKRSQHHGIDQRTNRYCCSEAESHGEHYRHRED
jgi:hypothetical protein